MKRIQSIDVMRGLVVMLMALDHTRDLLHIASITHQPTDLSVTTPLLFFTRWVTHLCAPTFVFLSGTSAYLSFRNKKNMGESRKYLLARGLWLIVLDLTLVNFGVWYDIHFNVVLFDVLSAIGVGFIVLSFLLGTRTRTTLVAGLAITSLHNLSPLVPVAETSLFKAILMPLFGPGAYPLPGGGTFMMAYPPIPWLGIILVGFSAGKLFGQSVGYRKKMFLGLAALGLSLFAIIRGVNIYGDSVPWTVQKDNLFTFLSFINVTKYPPSLVFCLLTLGSMFLVLYFVEGTKGRLTGIAQVFGKVPLFFFLVHWYVIHPIMFAMVYIQGFRSGDLVFGFNFGRPAGSGLGLGIIYLIWIFVLLLMYPLCLHYGRYKEAHKDKKWLTYL